MDNTALDADIIVAGGGPAGMMAAIGAAQAGARVVLLEKKPRLGVKLSITGKSRCNITNAASVDEIVEKCHHGKFLYRALHEMDNNDLQDFFRRRGLDFVVERGGRIFPCTGKARDVVRILENELHKLRVRIICHSPVMEILTDGDMVQGVATEKRAWKSAAVILATGGASYPGTGSTGDGYLLAQKTGHNIIAIRPALVPLEVAEAWAPDLQGLSLKNVEVVLQVNGKQIGREFGEMLFTHFGVSGPVVLTLSNTLASMGERWNHRAELSIDLKPGLSEEKLHARILRDFQKYRNKLLKNSLNELLPRTMIPVIIGQARLDPDKFVHSITKTERQMLVDLVKGLRLTVTGTRPLSEAIVTAGGINIREINAGTMESKLIKGLYFAGEIIDYHGKTGGYNLQGAFSTGYLAGGCAAKAIHKNICFQPH
ncbi:MAG: NAD(P)/FAD-dependent oxidoreductase [Bacillota bacterium]